jgi:hypothetical protein
MRTALVVLLLALPALAQRRHRPAPPPTPTPPPAAPAPAPTPPSRGVTRIDMEQTDLKGQRPAYGAVVLYDRKDLKVRSMVKTRESFRDEISF